MNDAANHCEACSKRAAKRQRVKDALVELGLLVSVSAGLGLLVTIWYLSIHFAR